ncbi:type II toxin-antitoxin system HicA family toxin [Candidatus Uhrbacteria bacterium]|nr:type II toxin-antitoxin system HicA family toxin [Candidatus Uhrbacteria bacterium]
MPKFYSSDEVIKALIKKGFVFVSQKGSHMKFRLPIENLQRTVIVPADRREIPIGTLKSILRQAGLTQEKLDEILN